MTCELHPVGPEVATGLVFHAGDRLVECMQAYRDDVESAPDEVSTLAFGG